MRCALSRWLARGPGRNGSARGARPAFHKIPHPSGTFAPRRARRHTHTANSALAGDGVRHGTLTTARSDRCGLAWPFRGPGAYCGRDRPMLAPPLRRALLQWEFSVRTGAASSATCARADCQHRGRWDELPTGHEPREPTAAAAPHAPVIYFCRPEDKVRIQPPTGHLSHSACTRATAS